MTRLSRRAIQVVRSARHTSIASFRSNDESVETQTELDSHADTCVLGANVLITHDLERPVDVTGYNPSDGSKVFKTVSGALGYMDGGVVHILHVHQAIHMPTLDHNLLCPMQLRLNDVVINE